MNINNSSLDGYIKGGQVLFFRVIIYYKRFSNYLTQETNSQGILITDKSCLIMDEVDGMSAGDRGGVGALNALIKKTKVSS